MDLITPLLRMDRASLICTRTQLCEDSHSMIVKLRSFNNLIRQKAQCCEIRGFIKTAQQGGNLLVIQVLLVWELVRLVKPEFMKLPHFLLNFICLSSFPPLFHIE